MQSIHKDLKNSLARLKPYLEKNRIEAYRLYNCEDFPVAIDIYKKHAVIHLFDSISDEKKVEIESALKALDIDDFFYKNRAARGAGTPLKAGHKEITIEEHGHKFLINLSDYLDTGLFLDHRETRKFIESKSKNKIMLNTFAYTGSFTIYAASGGATKTYSVDLSKTYCEWIKKNLSLNNLPTEKNWIYKMDTLEFFRYAKRKNLAFDIIIIDPPTFSKNKSATFSVARDYPALLNAALELLNPKGFILFSNNCRDFFIDKNLLQPCRVREEKHWVAPDFVNINPHKCFLIYCLIPR